MWLVLTTIGWVAFDETSDRGDLALRWAFYPFGIVGVVGLLMYYNCYAEAHDDHVVAPGPQPGREVVTDTGAIGDEQPRLMTGRRARLHIAAAPDRLPVPLVLVVAG